MYVGETDGRVSVTREHERVLELQTGLFITWPVPVPISVRPVVNGQMFGPAQPGLAGFCLTQPTETLGWITWSQVEFVLFDRYFVYQCTAVELFVQNEILLLLILHWNISFTHSQWRYFKIGMIWWNVVALVTVQTAALRTSWRQFTLSGREME